MANSTRHRVFFVASDAPLGGAERSLLELTARLHKLSVATGCAVPAEGQLSRALAEQGTDVHVVPMRTIRRSVDPRVLGGYLIAVAHAARQIDQIIRKNDYGIVHSNTDMAHIYGGEAAKRAGVPAVWHCREMSRLGMLAPHLIQRADRVVAVSGAVEDHLRAMNVPEVKLMCIPNGIDMKPFPDAGRRAEARRAARKTLGVDEHDVLVCTAAPFVPLKHLEDFITVFDLFSKLAMTFCEGGDPPAGLAERIQAAGADHQTAAALLLAGRAVIFGDDVRGFHESYAEELKKHAQDVAGARILFPGWRDDLPALLPAADAFLSTSRSEGFGRVLVEAMAAGVPVITNDAGGKKTVVEDGRTGRVVPVGSLTAMAEALYETVTDPAAADRLAQNAYREVQERFDISRVAEAVFNLYEELATEV